MASALYLAVIQNFKSGGNTINAATIQMTTANFLDDTTIEVVTRDGEIFTLKTIRLESKEDQKEMTALLVHYFDKNFSDDKSSMVYWVLMDMMANTNFSFYSYTSDRSEERKRIGTRIRQLREEKEMEAKHLAILANVDAASLSRIEQGRYSVGLDILTRIAHAVGKKVDLV